MRKFTIRVVKGEVSIVECELEMLSGVGEPGLQPGEWKARILKPDTFHMKRERVVDGKKEVYYEPDVWCWHAFHDTEEEARTAAAKLIEHEFAFNLRKYGTAYTEADVATATAAVALVSLKA